MPTHHGALTVLLVTKQIPSEKGPLQETLWGTSLEKGDEFQVERVERQAIGYRAGQNVSCFSQNFVKRLK